MSELAKALLAFQKAAPDLQRDAINPHFGKKFLSLNGLMDKVLPVANECGLVISQWPCVIENGDSGPKPALRTIITHAESGEVSTDVMLLMPGKDDPQGQGSAITYARRYSLMAALGLVADEDDDGNAATGSGAGNRGGSSAAAPAPDKPPPPPPSDYESDQVGKRKPFSEARPDMTEQEYLALAEIAQLPKAIPSQQMISFGKNKGVLLGELTQGQLRWYAEDWQVQADPSPYDVRLKSAAVALHAGNDEPEWDIPF